MEDLKSEKLGLVFGKKGGKPRSKHSVVWSDPIRFDEARTLGFGSEEFSPCEFSNDRISVY